MSQTETHFSVSSTKEIPLTWKTAAPRLDTATYCRLFWRAYTIAGTDIFNVSFQLTTMEVYKCCEYSEIVFFWKKIIMRHVNILSVSERTTAVVVMYMLPLIVREYRMLMMRTAFCIVSTTRLPYFSVLLSASRTGSSKSTHSRTLQNRLASLVQWSIAYFEVLSEP